MIFPTFLGGDKKNIVDDSNQKANRPSLFASYFSIFRNLATFLCFVSSVYFISLESIVSLFLKFEWCSVLSTVLFLFFQVFLFRTLNPSP